MNLINSGSNHSNLEWSQGKDAVKLLTLSVAQMQHGMKVGEESVNALSDSFAGLITHVNAINDILQMTKPGEERNEALRQCLAASEIIQSSIVAFQFYDRLQQCLEHVSQGLEGMSELIGDPIQKNNPLAWRKFQEEMRKLYTMESEKRLYDAIIQGKSLKEAMRQAMKDNAEDDDVELF